jgi:hypothetical protein
MNGRRLLRAACLLAAALLPGACILAHSSPSPCSAPEYHQFDFWIGNWNAFDIGHPSKRVAVNRVTRILGGCVLLEDYRGADGHDGRSFSLYDAAGGLWRQAWVTNDGQILSLQGRLINGQIVLSGSQRTSNGGTRYVQGVWKRVPGGVRETAVTSTDNHHWNSWFDMIFRPAHPAASGDRQP